MKFPEKYPTTIMAIIFLVLFIAFCLWFAGDKYQADLSNDKQDYQDGGSMGHPLWP